LGKLAATGALAVGIVAATPVAAHAVLTWHFHGVMGSENSCMYAGEYYKQAQGWVAYACNGANGPGTLWGLHH
jgi:hypothetical protein